MSSFGDVLSMILDAFGIKWNVETVPESPLVKNINGTAQDRFKIDGLYQKYLAAGGGQVSRCQVKGCSGEPRATAHVQKFQSSDRSWYLTRLCSAHNHHTNGDVMALRQNAKLITVVSVSR
jgi:hypothetical protein